MAAFPVHSDFGAQENKVCHCFHFSPSICHEVMGLDVDVLNSCLPAFAKTLELRELEEVFQI